MADLHIRMDQVAIARMLRSPGGPVGRDLLRRGKQAQFLARQLAPKGMRPGITAEISEGPRGVELVLNSAHPATLYIINGTKDHGPVRAKVMHFYIGGREVWAMHVRGIKANDFLGKALLATRI